MTTVVFKSEQAREAMVQWFERFRAALPVPTHGRSVPTGCGDTHVLVGGPAHGPAVVVLHGAMASSAHVLRELAPLLERFRVYAVDIVGQSPMSAEHRPAVDNDEYGQWLLEVLDGLQLPRAHVIGVSWGGFVAQRLARVAPERIERLVLLVPAGMVKGSAWQGFTRMGWPMLLYRMFPNERRLTAFLKHLLTTPDDALWRPYLGEAFRAFNMDMRVPALTQPGELEGLAAPTLVLGADQDVSFPGHALLERAAELLPALADRELIEGCKHCPPTTEAFRRWLGARIGDFLQDPGVAAKAS